MDIEKELHELALMQYTVTVTCKVEDQVVTYFIDLFSYAPPDKYGFEARITSANSINLFAPPDKYGFETLITSANSLSLTTAIEAVKNNLLTS